jgi:hypothetical protein
VCGGRLGLSAARAEARDARAMRRSWTQLIKRIDEVEQ